MHFPYEFIRNAAEGSVPYVSLYKGMHWLLHWLLREKEARVEQARNNDM